MHSTKQARRFAAKKGYSFRTPAAGTTLILLQEHTHKNIRTCFLEGECDLQVTGCDRGVTGRDRSVTPIADNGVPKRSLLEGYSAPVDQYE
jgi:hypothetical protein